MWRRASRAHQFAAPVRHRGNGRRWRKRRTSAASARHAIRTSCASASATARHRRSTAAPLWLSDHAGKIHATMCAVIHAPNPALSRAAVHATIHAPTGRAHRSETHFLRTSKTVARRRAKRSRPSSATLRSMRIAGPSHTPRVNNHQRSSVPMFASVSPTPARPTLRSAGTAHLRMHRLRDATTIAPRRAAVAANVTTTATTAATTARCRSKCQAACACPSA